MRLQRLEINGFKSFSDRSELAFDNGVTAIVGPNGCGKSNVADAITWVMGEQSAKSLRGERMEDVLFSGSDARKPTASAEVRLRFSGFLKSPTANGNDAGGNGSNGNGANGHGGNSVDTNGNGSNGSGPNSTDHVIVDEIIRTVAREVEVTRRLYRSGESEYLIDGRVCRLKDIHDLLMDTGLGAKAYAIIEQGKIGMILSSRPTDRRQLIEEAAGVTKYKARRRAAELKLEAARQNLTRIDDIVFEVEKQRAALKRQAARARRYQRLRDELRRWEKVMFAHKYRQIAHAIELARTRLADARDRASVAGGRVAAVEADLGRLRIELVEDESRANATREAAHAREMAISRLEQQRAFDRDQLRDVELRSRTVAIELETLEARRGPARAALDSRRQAAAEAVAERDRAGSSFSAETEAYEIAHRRIEGLEADVEAARSEVFSAINSATALRHALEHASSARDRVAETLSKLEIEASDVRLESARASSARQMATESMQRTQQAIEAVRIARAARESELASARIEHEWRSRSLRALEHELAGLEARLASLEELEAARAGYGDAARAVLVQANGKVDQRGAIADYLEVQPGYERAVESGLGDLLQYVVVDRPEQALAGFELVREAGAGRCGFLITSLGAPSIKRPVTGPGEGSSVRTLSSVVDVNGPFADEIRGALGDLWIAPTYEDAASQCVAAPCPVVSVDGDLFHGPHLVSGGGPAATGLILETKREIRELRDRIGNQRGAVARLSEEAAVLETVIAQAANAVSALAADHHKHEKALVGFEAQARHASDEEARLALKAEQLARERRQAEGERDALDARQTEARASIARLDAEQRGADERLTAAQRCLFEAREAADDLSRRVAESGAAHAGLVERANALAAVVDRLEEAFSELEQRTITLSDELTASRLRDGQLQEAIGAAAATLEVEMRALDELRFAMTRNDEGVAVLRSRVDEQELLMKDARALLDAARAEASELDVARATAEAELSHLAHTCEDAVNETLDRVLAEVQELESQGSAAPSPSPPAADVSDEEDACGSSASEGERDPVSSPDVAAAASVDEAIAALRQKIDRLGPVNMMAIEQFDELETRHTFLIGERQDLVSSIAQTTEAIARIDQTTRQRFSEAFAAINRNFQEMFATLFGGGRAGLTLIDETDPLESGIEIIAQPPGKRLQSVQLLSGGEKALTAIALMFGMFKYKPSPFCLLDEIDAPLDDANIGRFVEMLRGMLGHTQFIVITHNRKTMEIADRLYGVTMEEPGVSKLISVQLN